MKKVELELEMTWTPWHDSCRDPAVMDNGELRQCRRRAGHTTGRHASGFGKGTREWD